MSSTVALVACGQKNGSSRQAVGRFACSVTNPLKEMNRTEFGSKWGSFERAPGGIGKWIGTHGTILRRIRVMMHGGVPFRFKIAKDYHHYRSLFSQRPQMWAFQLLLHRIYTEITSNQRLWSSLSEAPLSCLPPHPDHRSRSVAHGITQSLNNFPVSFQILQTSLNRTNDPKPDSGIPTSNFLGVPLGG